MWILITLEDEAGQESSVSTSSSGCQGTGKIETTVKEILSHVTATAQRSPLRIPLTPRTEQESDILCPEFALESSDTTRPGDVIKGGTGQAVQTRDTEHLPNWDSV